MKNSGKQIFTAALLCIVAGSTDADDTEIYIGNGASDTEIKPNVLFIIDTSGSMGSSVRIKTVYDPSKRYSGSCDAEAFYMSNSCKTKYKIPRSKFVCDSAMTALNGAPGRYSDRFARYAKERRRGSIRYRWKRLSSRDGGRSLVECKADYGKHGSDASSGKYPADSTKGGPFTSIRSNAVNWRRTGGNATIYSGNYLNWYLYNGGSGQTSTRLEVVKMVFSDLLDSTSSINAALMRFDRYGKGGYFISPMLPLTTANKTSMKNTVNSLSPGGNTPLAETMYEAYRYFSGLSPKFGKGKNVDGVETNGVYKSPFEYQCQKNFIVYLTDGEPTSDGDADSFISSIPGFNDLTGGCKYSSNDCLDELAHYMFERDLISTLDGKQNVTTYTIGFHTDQRLLSLAASKSGGKYYKADNVDNLSMAFDAIITEIMSVNTSFIAPSIPVNAFNRLTHRNELYFALFRPASTPFWDGNVKKYGFNGTVIVDANNKPAIDPKTGFFKSTSTSYWTPAADSPDGDEVAKGGAASVFDTSRTVYTYVSSSPPINVDLTSSDHAFHENNSGITKSLLGISGKSAEYRRNLIRWARGIDVDDEDEDGLTNDARRKMGDLLHSQPVVVVYGGTDANPDITLFAATNDGFLHAIDTKTGKTHFSFIPKELLPNLDILYSNTAGSDHPYGLDGPITVWLDDKNGNGKVLTSDGSVESGEKVMLYVGMRRGGRNLYAFDVTNRKKPILKWVIEGGKGNFKRLGQTWSRPMLARIRKGGSTKTVLVFGGGYDDVHDAYGNRTASTQGNAIYMVDAESGSLLWSASPDASSSLTLPAMEYSIPAGVKPVDIDSDGLLDILYAADMGGRIWRFDFDLDSSGNSTAKGGIIADVGGSLPSSNRRFYNAPDVSLVARNGKNVLSVAIGSGWRAHPLDDKTRDLFMVIFDSPVHEAPEKYEALKLTDLYNATTDLSLNGLADKKGWYMMLETGEKSLAPSRTADGMLLFTTFKPSGQRKNSCSPGTGVARLYVVDLMTSKPVYNLDGVGDVSELTESDRRKTLTRAGIAPEPSLIFPQDGSDPKVIVGTEIINEVKISNPMIRTSWKVKK